MALERNSEIFSDFSHALERLKESLREPLSKGDIVVDGVIQRFEFTFELAWKLAQKALSYSGVNVNAPRFVIKEAFKAEILKDGDRWIDMLEDRNKTVHLYDEKSALEIYEKIKEDYYPLLEEFRADIINFLPGLTKNSHS
jgi:nucleotidyltransferase substrate binding protein (TIGR01987 family)